MKTHHGIIEQVFATNTSGLASLRLRESKGRIKVTLYADNGPLMRALNAAFPGFITPGHTVNPDVVKGQHIIYTRDDFMPNMIGSFTPSECDSCK